MPLAELAALRAHIDEVLGDELVPADMAATRALDEVSAIANETLRLRPVAPLMFFENVPEVTLGDLRLRPRQRGVHADAGRRDRSRARGRPHGVPPAAAGATAGSPPRCSARAFRAVRLGPADLPRPQPRAARDPRGAGTLFRSFELERVGRASDVGEDSASRSRPPTCTRLRRRRLGPTKAREREPEPEPVTSAAS